jgi:hypothetical protein
VITKLFRKVPPGSVLIFLGLIFYHTAPCSVLGEEGARLIRMALVIGNNSGLPGEMQLRHAVQDARSFANALLRSGSFEKDRVYILESPGSEEVLGALREMEGRVKELKKAGNRVLVIVFYSGHGGPDALHVGGRAVLRSQFLSDFRKINGNVTILIVDACESGGFLRKKGGRIVQSPVVEKVDELQTNGTAILSSSAMDQLAVESDELGSSLFTHHLVNGLAGAADFNRDGVVTLWEVFNYSKSSTEWEAASSQGLKQTPGFDFDLVGTEDVPLSKVDQSTSHLLLRGFPFGKMEILPSGGSGLRSRIWLRGGDTITYSLAPGKYILTLDNGNTISLFQVDLTWKRQLVLSPKDFKTYSKESVRYKGGSFSVTPHTVALAGSLEPMPEGNQTSLLGFQYLYALFPAKIGFEISYGSDGFKGAVLANTLYSVKRRVYALGGLVNLPIHKIGPFIGSLEGAVNYKMLVQEVIDLRFSDFPHTGSISAGPRTYLGNILGVRLGYQIGLSLLKGSYFCISYDFSGLAYRTSASSPLLYRADLIPGVKIAVEL